MGLVYLTKTVVKGMESVMDELKCKCGAIGKEEHSCPYSDEIGSGTVRCNCCEECMHQCRMDI